jgi:hypothetical protein
MRIREEGDSYGGDEGNAGADGARGSPPFLPTAGTFSLLCVRSAKKNASCTIHAHKE